MKFSIVNVLALITVVGLGVALYVEHFENEQAKAELILAHQKELQMLKEGITIRSSISNLIRNYDLSQQKSLRQDFKFSALVHVVNSFDYSEFLEDDVLGGGALKTEPALAIAAKLLSISGCQSAEDYFSKIDEKIKMLGMAKRQERLTRERLRLGAVGSERRKELTSFIQRSLRKDSE